MTSRAAVDTPAVLVTALLAVLLIAASAPFTFLWWGEGTTTYDVDWEEAEVGSDTATLNSAPASATAEVPVPHHLVSNVTIDVGPCNDGRGPNNVYPAAQMSYRLFVRHENGTEEPIAQGAFTCASASSAGGTFQRSERPDLGAREVDSGDDDEERDAARAGVWDEDLLASLNETSTYVLELSSTRGPAPGGLPIPVPPSLSVSMTLRVERWEALVHETGDDEVVR